MDYKKLFDMTGKVCIVTGGTGYLGCENVKALKDFGATVVVADLREAEQRWDGAPKYDYDLFVQTDIGSTESMKNLFKTVAEKFGRIDVLVNCANFSKGHGKESWIENMDDETWMVALNGSILSTVRGIREVIPYMKENGGGSIINYCSMYGIVAPDLRIYGDSYQRQPGNYGTAKGGVLQLTRYAASALAPYGIRVNAVTPGPFPNPANQGDERFNNELAKKTMVGRFGVNHEMAGAVLLLASDASTFMTGTNIVVDGGWTAW